MDTGNRACSVALRAARTASSHVRREPCTQSVPDGLVWTGLTQLTETVQHVGGVEPIDPLQAGSESVRPQAVGLLRLQAGFGRTTRRRLKARSPVSRATLDVSAQPSTLALWMRTRLSGMYA